jgi:uncharacterized cupredoxin-like copper-binding protein
MRPIHAQYRTATVSAILAASMTLFLGWPSAVNAVGNEEQAVAQQSAVAAEQQAPQNAALAKNEAKVGDLSVTATLMPSEGAPMRKVIRLECENPTDSKIAGKIQVALTRTSGSAMGRVMPAPQLAWRHIETVSVAPGEKFVRELTLPTVISNEVVRVEKLQERAAESDDIRAPNVYYGAIAEALDPSVPQASKQATRRSNRLPLVAMVPPNGLEL